MFKKIMFLFHSFNQGQNSNPLFLQDGEHLLQHPGTTSAAGKLFLGNHPLLIEVLEDLRAMFVNDFPDL